MLFVVAVLNIISNPNSTFSEIKYVYTKPYNITMYLGLLEHCSYKNQLSIRRITFIVNLRQDPRVYWAITGDEAHVLLPAHS